MLLVDQKLGHNLKTEHVEDYHTFYTEPPRVFEFIVHEQPIPSLEYLMSLHVQSLNENLISF